MKFRNCWFFLVVILSLLLSSCGSNGDTPEYDIVGRWEAYNNEEHSEGVVIEFTSDGENAAFLFDTPINYLYPAEHDQRRYLYSTRDDIVSFSGKKLEGTAAIPLVLIADIYRVAWTSADQLVLTSLDKTQVLTLQRATMPEMPFPARSVLGIYLEQEGCSLLGVEPLTTTWQETYPGYVETERAWSRGSDVPGQWVASLQVEGDPDIRFLVLVEGSRNWSWILLEKED